MRYLMTVSYDGSKYYGFQRLNNKASIQGELENALSIINKKNVEIKGSGRTDRGVHSIGQKVHFDLDVKIPEKRLINAVNSLLSDYIRVTDCKIVSDDFHARFNTLKKEYIYKINMGEFNPKDYDYILQVNRKLNIKEMKKCAKLFIGAHNFKNFVSGTRDNYDCIIYDIDFKVRNNILVIKFTGKSFYRYMVRNLIGTMLDIESKKITLEDIKNALDNPEVGKQFSTALPQGLYLNKIYY